MRWITLSKTLISIIILFSFLFVGIEVFAESNTITRVVNNENTNGTDNIPADAYRMLDFRHYVSDNVTSYIKSYLNNSNSVDHDYYFFTNAANSNVDITIRKTTNENVKITFVLFKLDYLENNGTYTKDLTQIDCQNIDYDSNINSVNYKNLDEVDFEIESNQVENYYHPHDYTYEYENIDSTKHYSYCECGEYIEENHNYNTGYVWKNNTQHFVSCCCGRTILQGHAVLSGTTKCLLCKGNANMGFDILNDENSNFLNIEYSNILIIEYECLIDFLNDPNKYYNKEDNLDVS